MSEWMHQLTGSLCQGMTDANFKNKTKDPNRKQKNTQKLNAGDLHVFLFPCVFDYRTLPNSSRSAYLISDPLGGATIPGGALIRGGGAY